MQKHPPDKERPIVPAQGEAGAAFSGATGITTRALVLALILLVVVAVWGFYGELIYRAVYTFSAGAPAMAALTILFLLTAINPGLNRVGVRALSRNELLTIYAVLLVGGPLVSHGILPWLLPYNIAQQYLARAIPEWQTSYLSAVPTWFGPSDAAAAEGYFQGRSAVPWALWWTPLAAWLTFLGALFTSSLCLVALLRRQWITAERLTFPIAQVPLEAIQGRGPESVGALPKAWPFWIGFLIPCAFGLVNNLSAIIPAIPGIPLSGAILMQDPGVGPMAGIGAITLELTPWEVAIAFLIPKELSFSCWFFWWVRVALTVTAIAFGATVEPPEMWYGSGFPAPHHQGGGAVLGLALWTLWMGRRRLWRALRSTLGISPKSTADEEPLSDRWVVLGFIVSFAYLVCFTIAAGARPLVGAAMVTLIVMYYLMWARLRAETGIGFLAFPFRVDEILVVPAGNAVFRLREVILLYDLRWAYYPGSSQSSEVLTGNAFDSFKIADSARIEPRPLLAAMLLGFVFSMIVTTYIIMTGMYHYGFQNVRANSAFSGWLGPQLRYIGGRIFDMLANPTGFDLNAVIAVAVGAVAAVGLSILRLRFWWWPFHPIGYLAASCWGMQILWMPFFVGWLLKAMAVRYGGLRLYRQTVPVAMGLIVGDFVSEGLWTIVLIATHGQWQVG